MKYTHTTSIWMPINAVMCEDYRFLLYTDPLSARERWRNEGIPRLHSCSSC